MNTEAGVPGDAHGGMDMLSTDCVIGDMRENTLGSAAPTRLETDAAALASPMVKLYGLGRLRGRPGPSS
jgi:hypothetical protein